ncbi:HNH endonuclease signature motif containing protein [Leifsonia poae]|uniref:HNH nuclease domain-containing protein n=1 Tax=Leifsonia poae TaxID=110933 RepID=A0A9W6H8S4_9MICO|nr:HNH endonuclease signature motif containing protein [Leifsonia poae]GLJ75817.1 hypothetical protein GCM10017584_13910 [Leifsonia poae]
MTSTPAAALREALAGLATPEALGGDALLNSLTTLGHVQAVLDAVKVRVVGELVARSNLPGSQNPVSRAGHSSPAALVEERWRVPKAQARRYCVVAESVTRRLSLTGETLPPQLPILAEAVDAPLHEAGAPLEGVGAGVGIDHASVIVRELAKTAPGCSLSDLRVGERVLVDHAPSLTVAELRTLASHVRDRLDQDGVVPREQRQRQRRSLTISTTSDGLTHVDWYLDPESAGYVVAAIDAHVGRELRAVRFRDTGASAAPGEADELPETRSVAQLRSDAATDVFRHVATCVTPGPAEKPPVTVIVRIDWDALRSGIGTGAIDGVATPVSAGTVRRMAADAGVIPVILGGGSQVLDFGRARRLFSTAQKLALAERDGGCAWAGCPHPPSYTEAHHIRWWNAHGGGTDLGNGVLLCSSHHHRVHDDGWEIVVSDSAPQFIPPAHVDPDRRPRAGGRVRVPLVA